MAIEQIINQIPVLIYWKDKQGHYLGCNAAFSETYHINNEQLLNKTEYDLFAKEYAEQSMERDQEVLSNRCSINFEETVITAQYKEKTYLSTRSPIYNTKGEITGIVCTQLSTKVHQEKFTKLTDAKQAAEQQHERTQIYLENIINNLPGHIYWCDENGTYLGCNEQQALSYSLTSPQEFIGMNATKIGKKLNWDKRLVEQTLQNDRSILETGKPIMLEEQSIWSDKNPRTFLSNKVPIYDNNNKIIGILGTSIDITQQKLAEQQLRQAKEQAEHANKMKTDFLMMISHELRTPLHGILGMAQLLLEESLNEQNHSHVKDIYQAGNLLLSHVNDILDYSTLELGKVKLESSAFNLKTTISTICKNLKPLADKKNIQLVCYYSENCPNNFLSDVRRISQVLLNLINNAIKFSEQDDIKIVVNLLKKNKQRAHLEISVIDSGVGIPASRRQYIFEQFAQLHASHRGQNTGTGLGLAISKKIIETMKGDIGVYSEPGQGSSFWFKLNLKIYKGELGSPVDNHQLKAMVKTHKKLSILLVEDDVISQRVANSMLNNLGYEIEIVGTANAALEIAANKAFDLILTDIGLPDKSGHKVIQLIRNDARYKKNKDAYIIAATAHALQRSQKKCLAIGANKVLTKPLNYQYLQAVLLTLPSSIVSEIPETVS